MRVAILHSGDLDSISPGGMDQYVKNLITGIQDSVTVYGVSPVGRERVGSKSTRYYLDVSYEFIPIIDDSSYPLCPRFMWALLKYRAQLSEYDCVLAQRIEYTLPLACSRASKNLVQIIHGSSASAVTHMSSMKARLYLLAERASVSIAKKTIVILKRAESGLPYYRQRYSRHFDRIVYGTIPVDLADFHPGDSHAIRLRLGIPASSFVVTYAGRVEDDPKRVFLFPKIAKELAGRCFFVIVGDGADLEKLKQLCRDHDVSERFIFAGYVKDRRKLAEYIAASDATINVSTDEGTCTAVLESLACGVPVISTDTGDIRQVLRNGKNGVVIEEGSEDGIVNAAAMALNEIRSRGCAMDGSYECYEKATAINDLRRILFNIQEA